MEQADDPTLLTPDEVVDYQLRRATRGYAVAEVDALLDVLAAQTERLLAEVADAEQRAAARGREVEHLRGRLAEAERAAEQAVAAARDVADAVVAEARTEAERLRREGVEAGRQAREAALRQVRAEEADLERRRRLVEEHVERLRQFADDHRERLQQHLRHEFGRLEDLRVPSAPPAPDLGRDPLLDDPLLDEPSPTAPDGATGEAPPPAAGEAGPPRPGADPHTTVGDDAAGGQVADGQGAGGQVARGTEVRWQVEVGQPRSEVAGQHVPDPAPEDRGRPAGASTDPGEHDASSAHAERSEDARDGTRASPFGGTLFSRGDGS